MAVHRIGILTGGGDAPGLNAVIRAVVKAAANAQIECVGLEDSFDGLIFPERSRPITPRNVTGILRLGDTILGTTNRGNPFAYPVTTPEGSADYSTRCVDNIRALGLDAIVVIGGDGTLTIAHEFHKRGVPIVGVPKTIDNDIVETTMTFGFDSAVAFATDAIDRLHTPSASASASAGARASASSWLRKARRRWAARAPSSPRAPRIGSSGSAASPSSSRATSSG